LWAQTLAHPPPGPAGAPCPNYRRGGDALPCRIGRTVPVGGSVHGRGMCMSASPCPGPACDLGSGVHQRARGQRRGALRAAGRRMLAFGSRMESAARGRSAATCPVPGPRAHWRRPPRAPGIAAALARLPAAPCSSGKVRECRRSKSPSAPALARCCRSGVGSSRRQDRRTESDPRRLWTGKKLAGLRG